MRHIFILAIILPLLTCFAELAFSKANDLPRLKIDRGGISVSGLSSGAFMAVQFATAHSSLISGVGVFAGGIYGCAKGNLVNAQVQCMALPDQLKSKEYVDLARSFEGGGSIDPLSNLKHQKIYLFSGSKDTTVKPIATQKVLEFYRNFTDEALIETKSNIPAGHGQPTLGNGGPCQIGVKPWILNCGYDGAGSALTHLYGPLAKPVPTMDAHWIEFNQSSYAAPEAQMADTGYLYIPTNCAAGNLASCRLHVALHGCLQSGDTLGSVYREQSGYNEWAEANNIVMLYPSTKKAKNNPNACWDWWGYTGPDYAQKKGPQIEALRNMIRAISAQ